MAEGHTGDNHKSGPWGKRRREGALDGNPARSSSLVVLTLPVGLSGLTTLAGLSGERQTSPPDPPLLITTKNIFVMIRRLLSLRLFRVMERFQSLEDKSQALGCLPGRIILHQVEFRGNYLQNSWTAG